MASKMSCPHCGMVYNVSGAQAAQKIRCQKCNQVFLLPATGAAPVGPPRTGPSEEPLTLTVQPARRPVQLPPPRAPRAPLAGDDHAMEPVLSSSKPVLTNSSSQAPSRPLSWPWLIGGIAMLLALVGGIVTASVLLSGGADSKAETAR